MSNKISRTNLDLDYLNSRLDEIRMSSHERVRAKARLAQAQAIANGLGTLISFGKRLLKSLAGQPVGRPSKLAG